MAVNILETEVLKANSDTSVSTIRLSESDNCMVRVHVQTSFFYFNKTSDPNFMPEEKLKSALRQTLDDFPDITGRIKVLSDGSLEIECENQGIQWVAASTPAAMKDLVDENFAQQKIPDNIMTAPTEEEGFILKIQFTRFDGDGSVLISIASHHAVVDAHGLLRMMRCWADQCQGKPVDQPVSDRSVYSGDGNPPKFSHPEFQLRSALPPEFMQEMMAIWPQLTAEVFSADRAALDKLKDEVSKQQKEAGITSFVSTNDAVSALLWCTVMRNRSVPPETEVFTLMACNGRSRSHPRVPDSYIGNANFFVRAVAPVSELVQPNGLGLAAAKIRKGVNGITPEVIQSSLNWVAQHKDKSDIAPGFNFVGDREYGITSWASFPIYEIDFGWGIPERFRVPARAFNNLALIFPGPPPADGVEVTLGFTHEIMEKVIHDKDFSTYFSLVR